MKRVNKKGQQMTLGTIIAIVLGIAVLVFLIFGFSTGWSNMWSKITALGGGEANVDDIVRGCEVACAGQSRDAFCRQKRTVNYGDGEWDKGSCNALSEKTDLKIKIKKCDICPSGSDMEVTDQDTEEEGGDNNVAQRIVEAAQIKVEAAQEAINNAGDGGSVAQKTALTNAQKELEDAEANL